MEANYRLGLSLGALGKMVTPGMADKQFSTPFVLFGKLPLKKHTHTHVLFLVSPLHPQHNQNEQENHTDQHHHY